MSDSIESDIRFRSLVQYLSTSAFLQLGKMANPATGEIDRNMEGARFFIDMLDSLAEKTKGGLSVEEDGELQAALNSLRLNYVDELKKDEAAAGEAAASANGDDGATGEADAAASTAGAVEAGQETEDGRTAGE